mgnify:FL=1
MELIKTTKKQINLCTDLEKDYEKDCMNIKVEYYKCQDDPDEPPSLIPHIESTFLDDELDPIKVVFDWAECIRIDTNSYKHISLTKEHVLFLLEFINYSERLNLESLRTTEEEVESLKKKDGI